MSRPSKVQYVVGIGALMSVAIALRMGPLLWSPLPFNPDGIVYAGLVRETVAAGELPLDGLPVDSFLFTAFLTVLELVVGEPARYLSQPVIAVVGALPCLVAVVIAHRVGAVLGWETHRRRLGGLLAGALLAVDGLYLHRSMPVDEQTVGLFLVPLLVLVLARAHLTERTRWFGVAVVLLVALPPLHNLDSVVALFLLAIVVFTRRVTLRTLLLGGGLTLGFVAYFIGYSWGVAAVTPAAVIQSGRVSYAPGLLLAWLILVTLALAKFARLRARTQRLLLATVFVSFLGLGALNTVQPIFPGTRSTPTGLLLIILPLFVPLLIGVWTIPQVDRDAPEWAVLLSLVGAVFVLMGMAFSATLTPEYLNTAYRAQTFLHFPMFVFAGVGVVTLLGRLTTSVSTLRARTTIVTVGAVLVICCAAVSIPVAFAGLELLSYKGTTTPAEFAAVEFGATHLGESWAADDHIARTSRYYAPRSDIFNLTAGSVEPVYGWIAAGGPPPDCPTITQDSWTTTGAQFYPRAPEPISQARLDEWQQTHAVIYRSSAPDPITVGMPMAGRESC